MKKLFFRIAGILATLSVPLVLSTSAHAVAATRTWTGLGADSKVSTVGNWDGGTTAPVDGDILVIPSGTPHASLNNDVLTSIGGIQLPGKTGAVDNVDITGAFALSGNISVDMNRTLTLPAVTLSADATFTQEYAMTGTTVDGVGDINIVGANLDLAGHNLLVQTKGYTAIDALTLPLSYDVYVPTLNINNLSSGGIIGASTTQITVKGLKLQLVNSNASFAGSIVANDAIVDVHNTGDLGTGSLVFNNSQLNINDFSSTAKKTFAQNITFNGNLYGATNDANFAIGQQGIDLGGAFDIEFSGTVAFQKDLLIAVGSTANARTVTFSGPISGSGIPSLDTYTGDYNLALTSATNTTSVPTGTYKTVGDAQTLTDSKPTENIIVPFGTVTINGSRGNVILSTGSVLKGTGTVGDLLIQGTASLKPGASPGCIASSNLTIAGIYEVDLGGLTACTEYDQTKVTGTVNLTGGTLKIVRYNNMVPRLNNSFTIISNDGTDKVTGTFTGLAQGATVKSDGITYTVSYTGGDGNDVVLTVTAVDSSLGAPNTGFAQLVKSGVVLPILAMLSGVGVLAVQTVSKRRK
jgi:hypothetical protein